jgi:hypothetical protein
VKSNKTVTRSDWQSARPPTFERKERIASNVVSGSKDIVFEFNKPNNSRTNGSSKLFGPALPRIKR